MGLRLVVSNDEGIILRRKILSQISLAASNDRYVVSWVDLYMRWMSLVTYTASAEGAHNRRIVVRGTAQIAACALESIADNADLAKRGMGDIPLNPVTATLEIYSLGFKMYANMVRLGAEHVIEGSKFLGNHLYERLPGSEIQEKR